MKQALTAIYFGLFSLTCLGQKAQDSLRISFVFPKQEIKTQGDLTLKVVYKNLTNRSIEVYKFLKEGYQGDRFFNISIDMQRLHKKKFVYHATRYYSSSYSYNMDSLRHFDLPKKTLPPFTSDTLSINLLDVVNMLDTGQYRFRAHLRVKTIPNNTPYNDPNFETAPPVDEIVYSVSKWFGFTVKNQIQLKKIGE